MRTPHNDWDEDALWDATNRRIGQEARLFLDLADLLDSWHEQLAAGRVISELPRGFALPAAVVWLRVEANRKIGVLDVPPGPFRFPSEDESEA